MMSLFSRTTYDKLHKVAITGLVLFSGVALVDCVFTFAGILTVRKERIAKIKDTKPEDIVV